MTDRAADVKHDVGGGRGAVTFIVVAAIVLGAIHLDLWWWDDGSLLFGFLPVGLGFHVLYSVLAALLWATACVIAWPKALEVADDAASTAQSGGDA